MTLHGLVEPVRLSRVDLVDDVVDLEAERLDLLVPVVQHLPGLEVDHRVDLGGEGELGGEMGDSLSQEGRRKKSLSGEKERR